MNALPAIRNGTIINRYEYFGARSSLDSGRGGEREWCHRVRQHGEKRFTRQNK